MQLGGIAPGNTGQIGGIHLEHREVGKRVGSDQLRRKHPAVVHGYANVSRTVDDVVIGHNVAIGRDDRAAAQSMHYLWLGPKLLEEPFAKWTKRLHLRRIVLVVAFGCTALLG